ncbi:uncharacterized protein LOC118430043 [Tachysurus ichikawai]
MIQLPSCFIATLRAVSASTAETQTRSPSPVAFARAVWLHLTSSTASLLHHKLEITRRRAVAVSALQSLWKPLQTISRKTKLRIYNSTVLSILLYGSETWPLNKTLAARLDGFDSRSLRTIENIRWPQRVSNQMLRAHTCQPRASSLAAQRRTRWLGHVLRLPSDHPTRAILQFDPKTAAWRRPRGVAIEDAEQLAQDRQCWKQLVHLVGSTHRDGTPPYPSQEPN